MLRPGTGHFVNDSSALVEQSNKAVPELEKHILMIVLRNCLRDHLPSTTSSIDGMLWGGKLKTRPTERMQHDRKLLEQKHAKLGKCQIEPRRVFENKSLRLCSAAKTMQIIDNISSGSHHEFAKKLYPVQG